MPFEDELKPKISKLERRWQIVSTLFPDSIARRFVDIEWVRNERERHEQVVAEFDAKIEGLEELCDSIQKDITAQEGDAIHDPAVAIEKIETKLDQAESRIEEVQELNPRYLLKEQVNTLHMLHDEIERSRQWLIAYERVGKCVDNASKQLDDIKEDISPYTDYEKYLITPKKREIDKKLNSVETILDEGFEAVRATEMAEQYIEQLTSLREVVKEQQEFISNCNELFVQKEAQRYNDLFTDIDEAGHDLSDEQKEAVIHDDKYNLVVAGAGSGKTVTLTHRIAYLTQRRDSVPPEKILAISYTNNAASVMEERLAERFGITGVESTTFHSLGNSIIQEEWDTKPEVFLPPDQRNFVESFISENTDDEQSEFKEYYFQFLKHFYDDVETDTEFESKEATVEETTNVPKLTLKQERVQSQTHKAIADFLFLHQVEYEYNSLQEWVEGVTGRGTYRADFYLPEYDIVISHHPVTADGGITDWGDESSFRDLETSVHWAREQFATSDDYRLVETYEFEAQSGQIERALMARLIDEGVILDEMEYEEFIESAFDYAEHKSDIKRLFASFINNARQLDLSPDEVNDRVKDSPPKEYAFGQCATILYREYCTYLQENDYVDFPGMLYDAIEAMQNDPLKYKNKYDQILVDEFQDISKAEVEFLKCFVSPENDTKLFCVGDDWQSIYSFSGSEVDFFINFEEYFDTPQTTELTANYRCPATVVEAGNDLIRNNERQREKTAQPATGKGTEINVHDLSVSPVEDYYKSELCSYVADLIANYKQAGADPEEIMVLARSNTFYNNPFGTDLVDACEKRDIKAAQSPEDKENPEEYVRLYSVHKSKGDEADHVIIIHAVEHLIGFPSQVENDDLLDPVQIAPEDNIAEERRLFYVALTRSSGTLDIVSSNGHRSRFVDEIAHHLTPAQNLSTLNGDEDRITICPAWLDRSFGSNDSQTQAGILSDGFGTRRFVIWEDSAHSSIVPDRTYRIENARVSYNDYNDEYELHLDDYTKIDIINTDGEKPSDGSR